MGPTLACPSAVREYIAFLQEHRVDVMSPAINPMTRVTIKVMTTLIVTTTPVERGAVLGAVVKKQKKITTTDLVETVYDTTENKKMLP